LTRKPLERKRAKNLPALAEEVDEPCLLKYTRQFLHGQIHPDDSRPHCDIPLTEYPHYEGKVSVFHSAAATFYAPSDSSGIGGMRREHIRATPSWRNGPPRYDCIFVNTASDLEGMRGLDIARVRCFFSFAFRGILYPCALVHWFERIGNDPDEGTGMWRVEPQVDDHGSRYTSVIHVDTILRAAHLIPVYGHDFIPREIKFYHSYDLFRAYYVNKFADHHAFTIAY